MGDRDLGNGTPLADAAAVAIAADAPTASADTAADLGKIVEIFFVV